jgi:hypothetical protein
MTMHSVMRKISVAVMVASAGPATAQTVRPFHEGRLGIALELMRPEVYARNMSGVAAFVPVHVALRPGVVLNFEIPFAVARWPGAPDEWSSGVGNPLVGLRLEAKSLSIEVNGRAPLAAASKFANGLGARSDLERLFAFTPNTAALTTLARADACLGSHLCGAALGGLTYALATGDDDGDDEQYLLYGLETSYRLRSLEVGARIFGNWITTQPELNPVDRSLYQLAVFADYGAADFRPTLQLRLPADRSMKHIVNWSAGLGVRWVKGR